MKKIFSFIAVLSCTLLLFAGPVMAMGGQTPPPNVSAHAADSTGITTGNGYSWAVSSNTADVNGTGIGLVVAKTGTVSFVKSDGFVNQPGFAVSTGIGTVKSTSMAGGALLGSAHVELMVSGSATGGSAAAAYRGTDEFATWASGGSYGRGEYEGYNSGHFCLIGGKILTGQAIGVSGTVAFAERGRIGDTQAFSIAGIITSSASGAKINGGYGLATAQGEGNVAHQTFAQPKVGDSWAATQGAASYMYNNVGCNNVSGAGFAGTAGSSFVTQTGTTASAHTSSVSFAGSTGVDHQREPQ